MFQVADLTPSQNAVIQQRFASAWKLHDFSAQLLLRIRELNKVVIAAMTGLGIQPDAMLINQSIIAFLKTVHDNDNSEQAMDMARAVHILGVEQDSRISNICIEQRDKAIELAYLFDLGRAYEGLLLSKQYVIDMKLINNERINFLALVKSYSITGRVFLECGSY